MDLLLKTWLIFLQIPKIFDAVFECTLDMINKDFEEHPEHRTNFFTLLQAVNAHCFPAFLSIPPQQFKLVLDSIIWAFKHTMRNVADTGLNILYQLLQNVSNHPEAAQSFYQVELNECRVDDEIKKSIWFVNLVQGGRVLMLRLLWFTTPPLVGNTVTIYYNAIQGTI